MNIVDGLVILKLDRRVVDLEKALIAGKAVPLSMEDDAFHIAFATVYECDYLMSWNLKHINNRKTKPLIRSIVEENGYRPTHICIPPDLGW